MQKNLSKTDRGLRIVAGTVIMVLSLIYHSWWGLLGLALLLNGITGRCGAYALIGFSTVKQCDTPAAKDKVN